MTRETEQLHGSISSATKEAVLVLLLLLSVAALHAGALRKPFFADDYFFLEQVRGQSLPAALSSQDPLGNFLRPISRQGYFWVVSRLGQESPVVFHVANLLLFLGSLVLLFFLVRRLGGPVAAFVATAFLGLHYAADVPLRWASGSQDLLALLCGSGAILLHARGRSIAAAVALFLGLLSKESVALAAVVAIVANHQSPERWRDTLRRGIPLMGATALWALLWVMTLRQRPATGQTLSFAIGDVLAVPAHLVQAALGLEFRLGGSALGHWSATAFMVGAVAAALLWLVTRLTPSASSEKTAPEFWMHSPLVRLGLVWTLAGALPLVVVMPIWSAYYYLFALAGVGLLIAGLMAALRPQTQAIALGALVMLSANARALDEFSAPRGSWTWQSHVDRHYLDRATTTIGQFLRQMAAARPTLPPKSTIFFANVPASLGWQAGNGPLVRWAYRDSSLRSYFLTQFSRERVDRGPVFFFAVEGDSLVDKTGSPMILPSFAYSMLLAERPEAALEALDLALESHPADRDLLYWRAWASWAAGDTAEAISALRAAGFGTTRELPAGTDKAIASVQDTMAKVAELTRLRDQASLSSWVHARLAAILLALPDRKQQGAIEAYAYKTLAPDDPDAWRKWSSAQLSERQFETALQSLEKYLALADARGHSDQEVNRVVYTLRRIVRGDMAQQALQSR